MGNKLTLLSYYKFKMLIKKGQYLNLKDNLEKVYMLIKLDSMFTIEGNLYEITN